MKQVQIPGARVRKIEPIVAWVVVVATGLALWGTAQTTEPEAAVSQRKKLAAATAPSPARTMGPRDSIAFPVRPSPAKASDDLFAGRSWYVPPPPPPPAKPAPPPAPVAPPLPFEYMGSYVTAGGGAVYFLVKGDRMYDVKVGDTLDGLYTVDAVENDQLLLTYLPLKQRQALSLGE